MIRKTAAVAATLGLMAAPAAAQETQESSSKAAPQTICKNESKKKSSAGKGRTLFAVCVSGARKANEQNAANERREARGQKPVRVVPGRICASQSRKKVAGAPKSAFAACVKGATEANKAAREAARQSS